MVARTLRIGLTMALMLVACVARAQGQSLGTFRWQFAPHCNVITFNVTQSGAIYTLDGHDDQCGASERASASGTAFPNPNGSIGMGFTMVTPGGTPVHVQVTIAFSTLSGTWRDNHGNAGPFVFTAGAAAGGSPRPLSDERIAAGSITSAMLAAGAVDGTAVLDGTIGAQDVDAAQIQRRVVGSCPAGEVIAGVNQDGSVTCSALPAGAVGDITAITPGPGLLGGGTAGAVSLRVDLQGSGTTNSAARTDHTHQSGPSGAPLTNTGVGAGAFATGSSTGNHNTALGYRTLVANGSGVSNTAVGSNVLDLNATGSFNTAVGNDALGNNSAGSANTAVGYRTLGASKGDSNTALGAHALEHNVANGNTAAGRQALEDNTTGAENVAVGWLALGRNTTGSENTIIGVRAGGSNLTGTDNVAAGHFALGASEAGDGNTALGDSALAFLSSGDSNIAVGAAAGFPLRTGSRNIFVGSLASGQTENNTIRIGSALHLRTFVGGIRGVTTGENDAIAVVVDSEGQLGTISSSRRTKSDIAPLAADVVQALHRLRPVQFRYRRAFADGATPIQYGLIAEEVQDVMPDLVALDASGRPETVKYHVLPSLLLADLQRLERERAAQERVIAAQQRHLATLRDEVASLREMLETLVMGERRK